MMTHTPMLDQSLIEDLHGLAQRNFIGLASCLGYLDDLLTKMATWVMEAEARFICGARGKHRKTGFQRWGTNPGSIRVGLERIAVRVPRVRDGTNPKGASSANVPPLAQAWAYGTGKA